MPDSNLFHSKFEVILIVSTQSLFLSLSLHRKNCSLWFVLVHTTYLLYCELCQYRAYFCASTHHIFLLWIVSTQSFFCPYLYIAKNCSLWFVLVHTTYLLSCDFCTSSLYWKLHNASIEIAMNEFCNCSLKHVQ